MSLKFESSIVSADGGKGSNIEFGCVGKALFLGFLLLLVNDNGIMKRLGGDIYINSWYLWNPPNCHIIWESGSKGPQVQEGPKAEYSRTEYMFPLGPSEQVLPLQSHTGYAQE